MNSYRMYVGTFTRNRSPEQGIFWYQFYPESGQLTLEGTADAGPDPAFLTLSADGRFLYSVNETAEFEGQPGGGVSAFAVEPASGALTHLNSRRSFGGSPCYISLDQTGKWVLVANYMGGNITVYPLRADGSLGPFSDFVQHRGHGPNPTRQEGPHAHSIRMDPTNRLALVADLGLDQVKLYQLDLSSGKLSLDPANPLTIHPGAGPRHLDFHPNGKWLYIVNELDSTLSFYSVDAGTFTHMQTLSTLPEGYSGEKWVADVHVHPNGQWVYVSNRAHDSLATFAIDPASGKVSLCCVVPSGGATPRNFALDPSGRWLIAAHQNGNSLVVFGLDPVSGVPSPNGVEVNVPAPVCVRFVG